MTWNEMIKQIESNLEQTEKNMIRANEKMIENAEKLNNICNELKPIKCRKVEINIRYQEVIL